VSVFKYLIVAISFRFKVYNSKISKNITDCEVVQVVQSIFFLPISLSPTPALSSTHALSSFPTLPSRQSHYLNEPTTLSYLVNGGIHGLIGIGSDLLPEINKQRQTTGMGQEEKRERVGGGVQS